ncbi:MAG: ABC transporter substrate-binding protein [Thermomicrobiales bacterium]
MSRLPHTPSAARKRTGERPPGHTSGAISRRHMLGASAAALLLMPAARSSAQSATPAAGWSYTDITGESVTLPAMPTRIAAMITPGAALWDFGVRPAGIFAWEATVAPDGDDPAWGHIDAAEVVNIGGGEAGNLDPEKLAALGADLVVTTRFDDATPYVQIDPEVVEQIRAFVPVVAAYQPGPALTNLQRVAELAQLLGADLDSPQNTADREAFETAQADLAALLAEKQGLRVLVIDPYEAEYGVVAPRDFDDLAWLAELGVPFIGADWEPGVWFESHSAEDALAYPADVVLISNLAGRLTADALQAHPTYGQHPAIKAGQIGEWSQSYIPSYPQLTTTLRNTIAALQDAEKVTP